MSELSSASFFQERDQCVGLVQRIVEESADDAVLKQLADTVRGAARHHRQPALTCAPPVPQLDKYQEQSQLLDPALEALIAPLMQKLRALSRAQQAGEDVQAADSFPHQAFSSPALHQIGKVGAAQSRACAYCLTSARHAPQAVYAICKVRGFKTVIKQFPHEVADLEPVLRLLCSQDRLDVECVPR